MPDPSHPLSIVTTLFVNVILAAAVLVTYAIEYVVYEKTRYGSGERADPRLDRAEERAAGE